MSFFSKWIDLIQQIFVPRTVYNTAEAVAVEVAAVEAKAVVDKVKPAVKAAPAKKKPKSPAKAEVAEKRTRKGGKFVGDDKSTPDVNEAFKGGKAPAKKPKKPNIKIAK